MATEETRESLEAGRYVFERTLGRGGGGEVFLAHDTQLGRWVALKRIHAGGTEAARAQAAVNEAKNLASLQHPNIVTVFDFFTDNDDVLVVMEFIHGHTLDELNAPLTLEDFTEVARQSLEGLGAAHSLGMLHRDIKCGNLMLAGLSTGRFQVKILDFGLAKTMDAPALQTVDHTGSLFGSIYTMAPEQFEQAPLDERTDLYSLGCVLFRALTLTDPFAGTSVAAVMNSHLEHRHESLASLRPDLPPALCAWVEHLFARQPAARPGTAAEARALLDAALMPRRPSRTPVKMVRPTAAPPKPFPWLLAGIIVAAVALAGGSFWFVTSKRGTGAQVPAQAASVPPVTQKTMLPTDRAELLTQVGKRVAVEGRIERQGENKAGTIRFLNFAGATRSDLTLVFFVNRGGESFSPERLKSMVGQRVRVEGVVSEFQSNPQIEIDRLDQITVLDGR